MGDQVYLMKGGLVIPVEPTGVGLDSGWMPGTWVKYSNAPLTFSGALCTVEVSDGYGQLAGMLINGPQHSRHVERLSDQWTTDTRQRDGGDNRMDMTAQDSTLAFEFDSLTQLQRVGTRVASMLIADDVLARVYVYEEVDSIGNPLVYSACDLLYVSDRGRITKEFKPNKIHTGYGVIRNGSDVEGSYLLFTSVKV